jgi:glycosyltransferase involved in cell wall biosynthesis
LERQILIKIPNVKLVQNPINVNNPQVVPWPLSPVLQIAVVARLDCNCKGQDILIQALADSSWKDIHFNVNLYGKGSDEEYIRSLIDLYKLQERVFLKGYLNEIISIWQENHILMLPSISEGTPISLVEAMSCGRSAIVTDVGDNARLINDNVNGFVSDGCNVNSLNKVLRRSISKKEEWKSMGEKAFADFKDFNSQDPAKTFLELLIAD